MKILTQLPLSPEVAKAIADGFTLAFAFAEGYLYCEIAPEKTYAIKDVQKDPRPCLDSQTIVYRLMTKDGLRGYAIAYWDENP